MVVRLEDLGPKARAEAERQLGVKARTRATARQPSEKDDLELSLLTQIRQVGMPEPVREHRFHYAKGWRFDFAWPDRHLAVEVDGGSWNGGAHVRGKHHESDCEKGCEATLLGWRVMHVNNHMVEDGRAVGYIEKFFAEEGVW